MIDVKVRLVFGGKMPERKSEGAAGFDVFAREEILVASARMTLVSDGKFGVRNITHLIPLGIHLAIPFGYEGQLRLRSSLGVKGLVIPNGVGTIDCDYRGEVSLALMNLSGDPITIHEGNRVGQIVFARVPDVELTEVDVLGHTVRGAGGFGSTGEK